MAKIDYSKMKDNTLNRARGRMATASRQAFILADKEMISKLSDELIAIDTVIHDRKGRQE